MPTPAIPTSRDEESKLKVALLENPGGEGVKSILVHGRRRRLSRRLLRVPPGGDSYDGPYAMGFVTPSRQRAEAYGARLPASPPRHFYCRRFELATMRVYR
jgi:hypothetical protein